VCRRWRSDDVDRLGENRRVVELDPARFERGIAGADCRHRLPIDVGTNDARDAALVEKADQGLTDVAEALHRNALAPQLTHAEMCEGCLHAAHHPAGGRHRGVAAAAETLGDAGGEACVAEDRGHVIDRGADILGSHVAAAEAGNEGAVLTVDGAAPLGIRGVPLPGDHPFGAAPPQTGQGILVGHPLGQAQAKG